MIQSYIPFDEIQVKSLEVVYLWKGKPMFRAPVQPRMPGEMLTISGMDGKLPVALQQDIASDEATAVK